MTAPLGGARGRRGLLAAAAATVALTAAGTAALAQGLSGPAGPPSPSVAAATSTGTPTAAGTSAAAGAGAPTGSAPTDVATPAPPDAQELPASSLPRSRPVSLDVPAIGISTNELVDLAKEADGTLEVPTDFGTAGWYTPGPAPGQFGPAVIAGHVDSKQGPAVFYRLGELRPGDDIRVGREDGSTARFLVDRVERYPKDRFPTVEVYGDTTHRAELRLITCGGDFDRAAGSYVDNVVVFAHLV